MKKKEILQKKGQYLKMGDKWFVLGEINEDGDFETGEWNFEKIDMKRTGRQMDEIVKKLSSSVDPKVVLGDALYELRPDQIDKLHKKMFRQKKKPKIKLEKHCVRLDVGGVKIPIRG